MLRGTKWVSLRRWVSPAAEVMRSTSSYGSWTSQVRNACCTASESYPLSDFLSMTYCPRRCGGAPWVLIFALWKWPSREGKLMKSVGLVRDQQILLDTSIKAWMLRDCTNVTDFFFLSCSAESLWKLQDLWPVHFHMLSSWTLCSDICLLTVGASIKEEKLNRWLRWTWGWAFLKKINCIYLVQERRDLNFLEQSDFCISVKQRFFYNPYCWLCTSHLRVSPLVWNTSGWLPI